MASSVIKISYEELKNKPHVLQSLTGLTKKEFEALEVSFSQAWLAFVEETFGAKERKRAYRAESLFYPPIPRSPYLPSPQSSHYHTEDN